MSHGAAAFLSVILVAIIIAIAIFYILGAVRALLQITRLLSEQHDALLGVVKLHEKDLKAIANQVPMFSTPERAAEIYRQNDALRLVVSKEKAS